MVTVKTKNNAVQKTRVTKGLSLRKLSEQSGVNYVTISKMENGKTSPNPSTALKVCNALGVKFEELFEIVTREPEAQTV